MILLTLVPSQPFSPRRAARGRAVLTGVGPHMSLQVEGVVEAFSTEGAQVPLHLAVALDVTVEHPLQAEAFAAQLTAMHRGIAAGAGGELRSRKGLA